MFALNGHTNFKFDQPSLASGPCTPSFGKVTKSFFTLGQATVGTQNQPPLASFTLCTGEIL
jgi:hypothetical protein